MIGQTLRQQKDSSKTAKYQQYDSYKTTLLNILQKLSPDNIGNKRRGKKSFTLSLPEYFSTLFSNKLPNILPNKEAGNYSMILKYGLD